MRIEYLKDDVEVLRPLANIWALHGKSNGVGIDVHVDTMVSMARKFVESDSNIVIVVWEDKEPVGVLALASGPSFLGRQRFAVEQHWYVKPESRGVGVELLEEAFMWAATHGCSHLIMGSSRLGGMEEKVRKFYEGHGFKPFSQSYILEVA